MRKYNDPTTLNKHLASEMKDPIFRQEWSRVDPEFALLEALVDLRRTKGLSQRQLAQKMKVTQAQIARLERGQNATIHTLKRIAQATGTKLKIEFV